MKKAIILSGLLLLSGVSVQAQDLLKEYSLRAPVTVRMPLLGDSVNFSGGRFQPGDLLKTPIDLDFKRHDCQRIAADSTGYASVAKAEGDNLLYLFSTRLRAERFMRATLQVSSPVRFEVFVDGRSVFSKTSVEDSLQQVRPQSVPLRMEPEKNYTVVVKLLSCADDKAQPKLKCLLRKEPAFDKVTCHAAPDMKGRVQLYDTEFVHQVYSAELSPNGKYLLAYYSYRYSADRHTSYKTLTEVKTGKTILPNANAEMRWMPRSNKLFYLVKGASGNDLITYDPATQKEEVMLRGIPDGHFRWSPTEDYLIYTVTEPGEKVQGPLKRMLHPDDRIPGSRDRSYLMKYDITTGLSERLTYGSCPANLNDISKDGKKLLCTSSKNDFTIVPFSRTSLFEIDLATLRTDTLVAWTPYLDNAIYSPDGNQTLIIAGPNAFDGIGKNCGNLPIANDYDKQAFILTLADKRITPITRDFNPSVEVLQWNSADGCIYFKTTDKDCLHIHRYVPSKKSFELLPLAEDAVYSFSLPDQQPAMAAYTGESDTREGAAYLYDQKKKSSTLIASPMKERLDDITFGDMEPWSFTAADGTLIEGTMCLPPDFDPTRKYPLIVYYYGGTLPSTKQLSTPYSPQLFASRDYVVYVIQPSGTIGYGQEFSARHVNAWGDYTIDEIIEGTRQFCASHPFVDDKKIGCIGASYGGFVTMYMQTKTDLFATAVSHAGISNVTSYWGEGYWGYSYSTVATSGTYPWTNQDLYTRHGALFNADKVNTPILLLQGTADTNVPLGESVQMYNALKILGKPVEYVTVDGENHFIRDYAKRELWHNTIMAWFARWLQDDPSWWNDLYPERHW